MSNDVRIGLAGVGYWGSKLARNIQEASGCRLSAISDPDPSRLEAVVARYPGCRGVGDLSEMLADDSIDAVVLATPASNHAAHARLALEAGKHVLVEKPLALNTAACDDLVGLAATRDRILMVGHTFIYSEPVRALRQLVEAGELGEVLYAYSQRLNLGIIREDLNALWNFGPHDVSIMLYLLGEFPESVSARQFVLLSRNLEDVAFLVLEFPSGAIAHIHESWLDPRKVRQLTVVGETKMVTYDDTDVDTPIRIYDKGAVRKTLNESEEPARRFNPKAPEGFGEFKLAVRAGDMLAPRIGGREPLAVEIEHFAECVRDGKRPITDGVHGRQVVAILEAADQSSRADGVRVPIEDPVSVAP